MENKEKREQLLEYKRQLTELNEYQNIQRDLHLKALADGKLQGPPTGFAALDKPWLKYFSNDQISDEVKPQKCFDYLFEENKNDLNRIAFEYLGKKYSYKDLFGEIEKAAMAFTKLGVKKGDTITFFNITTPETIFAFYALNKIGAIVNLVDVRYTPQAMEHYINEVNSKFVVMLDLCYERLNSIIKNTKVEKVIVVSPTNSASKILKNLMSIKATLSTKNKKINQNIYINWDKFIKQGLDTKANVSEFEENYPCAIVHTGGTTGVPKGVQLSNENFNIAALEIKHSNAATTKGDSLLNIMPPFIAYGVVLGIHTPLVLGWKSIIIPKFEPKKFDDLLLKYKPNCIFGVPAYWENIMSSKKTANADLSFIKDILLGGDRTIPEFEKRLTEYIRNHKSNANIGKGYSLTEASASATFSSKKANELDSVGVPLFKTTISTFAPNTTNELGYNEVGELCIKTPTQMIGYFENEEATREMIRKHADGEWIHTGDIGYVNENGIVFVKDRIKRIIPRSGFKVFPSQLENLFLSHPYIKACSVVSHPDPVDVASPKTFIVLKDEYIGQEELVIKELQEKLQNSILPPYFAPTEYEFIDSIPLTKIGKVDFMALQDGKYEGKGRVLKR